jgi:cation:H+ antiporter
MFIEILLFLVSCFILSWLSGHLVKTLVEIAKYLNWREFIVAFFVMAFAASLPNLFVDLGAALRGMPEVALGDILGGNLVDLTIVAAVAVLFAPKDIKTDSKMVQGTAVFTSVIALLPLLLILDGSLDRIDGVVLIFAFIIYSVWLFSKEDRFKKVYSKSSKKPIADFKNFAVNIVKIIFLLGLLLFISQWIVGSVKYFSENLGISLSLVGILIVGIGNCFPETYFSIISARKGQGWMVLGDLMGSIIVCATLVLGIVALVAPFEIKDFSPFLIARVFLIFASIFFLIIIRRGKSFTKKEGLVLLSIYIIFLITEVFRPHLWF